MSSTTAIGKHHPAFEMMFFQMEAPHTRGLIRRHIEVAKHIATSHNEGWHYSELEDLTELMMRFVQFYEDEKKNKVEILNTIFMLVENCCFPFIADKASDVITYREEIPKLVEIIGAKASMIARPLPGDTAELIDAKKKLRAAITEFITSFTKTGGAEAIEGKISRRVLAATGTAKIRIIFGASDVLEQLVEGFKTETNPTLVEKMLIMFRNLAVFRPISKRLMDLGLPILLLRLLKANVHKTGEVALVAAELLGSIVEIDAPNASAVCGESVDFFEVLSEVLNKLVSMPGVKYKICRNDLATILMLLMENGRGKFFKNLLKSGLFAMMLFWVVKDCGDYNRVKELAQGSVRNMRPLTDPLTIFDVNALRPGRMGSAEDVQLRIILWRAVAFAVSNDEDCAKEGENYGFTTALLAALKGSGISGGSTTYGIMLQSAALSSISMVLEGAVGLRKVFAEADGVNIVLRYVQRLVGERHSRSGSVDTQQHYAKLFSKSLNTLMLGLEFCKASVTEENTELSTAAVPILCGIIAMDGDTEMRHDALPPLHSESPRQLFPAAEPVSVIISSPPVFSRSEDGNIAGVISQECRNSAMQCLSLLSKKDPKRLKEIRNCDGLRLIVRQLQKYSSGREALLTAWGCDGDVDGTLSSGICAVDCVWNCVVGDKKSEEKFIVHLNGVGHLLECFEVGPNVLKRQIMGCLSDLIASSLIAKSQFLQWSSPITLKSGVKLVLELVVGEQQGLGAIDDDGSILDINRPWNPTVGDDDVLNPLGEADSFTTESAADEENNISWLGKMQKRSTTVYHTSDMYDSRMRSFCLLSQTVGFEPQGNDEELMIMKSSMESRQSSAGLRDEVLRRATLTREELQQLEAMRPYPQLRELELWEDLKESLGRSSDGVGVSEGDRKWIEDNIGEQLVRSRWVKSVQQDMASTEKKAELHDVMKSIESQVAAESAGSIPA